MKQFHLVQQVLEVLDRLYRLLVLFRLVDLLDLECQVRLYSLLDLVVLLNLFDLVCQVRLEVLVRLEDQLLGIRQSQLSLSYYIRIIRMAMQSRLRILDLVQLKKVGCCNLQRCHLPPCLQVSNLVVQRCCPCFL